MVFTPGMYFKMAKAKPPIFWEYEKAIIKLMKKEKEKNEV